MIWAELSIPISSFVTPSYKGKNNLYSLNSGDIFFEDFTLEKIFNEELSNKDVVFGNTVIKNEKYKYISISKNFDLDTIVMPFCHQSSLLKSN